MVYSASPCGQRRLVTALHLLALCLAGLLLYVRTLPATATPIPEPTSAESAWWGLWPVTYLPAWVIYAGVTALVVVLIWLRRGPWPNPPAGSSHALRSEWILPGLSLIVVGAFFLFPIVHTRWGDAYILSQGLAWPDPAGRLTYSWQAPLDLFIHSRVWLLFHERFQWTDAIPVYRLLSPLAGLIYLAAALGLSRHPHRSPAWLSYGLLVSLGVIQLFFGYVENYSYAAAGILVYLWLGIELLAGRRPLWPAALALAITVVLHPSALVYLPSYLFLVLWLTRSAATQQSDVPARGKILVQAFLPFAAVIGATLLLMETGGHGLAVLVSADRPGGGDGRWFVPLLQTATRWEQYTMFSWLHLRDILNEQLLVGPTILPALCLTGIYFLWQNGWRPLALLAMLAGRAPDEHRLGMAIIRFLLLAALSHLTLTWIWNPDYGGQRDWDLFALAQIPVALLLVHTLPRALSRSNLMAGALPLLLLQLFHTVAWIYQNRLPWSWPV